MAALQQTGPVMLVLPPSAQAIDARSAISAGLTLGYSWTLQADIGHEGVDESLCWLGLHNAPLRIHALPSSNWRPFDRLARSHRGSYDPVQHQRSFGCKAAPLWVDSDLQLRLLRWSQLTRLDQERGFEGMRRWRMRSLFD